MPEPAPDPPLVEVAASHLYPGATGRIAGSLRPGPCLVVFADGAQAGGRLLAAEGGALGLAVAAYTTARGTAVAARSWRIAAADGRFRVTARGPAG